MAFVNNKSNQNTRVNTTSKVIQLYNQNGNDAGTLTLGFWNDFVSLKINPILEPSKRLNNQVYNYDLTASVVLKAESLKSLVMGIKEHVLPGTSSVAVNAGQYMIKVGRTSEYEDMSGEFYLGLFEVNAEYVQTGGLFYTFEVGASTDDTVLLNWDENTGVATDASYNTQWEIFMDFLDLATRNVISGGSHGSLCQVNNGLSKLSGVMETMKALVEMLVTGRGGSVQQEPTRSTGGFGGGRQQRKQRDLGSMTPNRQQQSTPVQSAAPTATRATSQRISRNKPEEEVISSIQDINIDAIEVDDIDLDDME